MTLWQIELTRNVAKIYILSSVLTKSENIREYYKVSSIKR